MWKVRPQRVSEKKWARMWPMKARRSESAVLSIWSLSGLEGPVDKHGPADMFSAGRIPSSVRRGRGPVVAHGEDVAGWDDQVAIDNVVGQIDGRTTLSMATWSSRPAPSSPWATTRTRSSTADSQGIHPANNIVRRPLFVYWSFMTPDDQIDKTALSERVSPSWAISSSISSPRPAGAEPSTSSARVFSRYLSYRKVRTVWFS